MADIEQYLKEILQAVYGEEVRGSIHDAIEAMNNDIYDNTVEVKGYAESAQKSATNSEASAQRAATSASSASTSASQAFSSASSASTSASQASSSATEAKSWAVGGTSSRAGENTDNAKYYSDEAKRAANGISGALTARGTITFAELQEKTSEMSADTVGYMYNISTDFTTDSTFMEGSGIPYKAGTNVYWCAAQKWDCLAASVKENVIETVKVNGTALIPDVQKAVDVKAYNEDNKPEVGGRNYVLNSKDHFILDGGASNFKFKVFELSEPIPIGTPVVFSAKNVIVTGNAFTAIVSNDSYMSALRLDISISSGDYVKTESQPTVNYVATKLLIYAGIAGTTSNKSISMENVKLERGEIATDWTLAPEDLEAKIPTKTSQLQNDSNFITSAQIPEGAAASNTVPKPLGPEGVVGNELAFARGDHVHPFSDLEMVTRRRVSSDWNDYVVPGIYGVVRAMVYPNAPNAYNYGTLVVMDSLPENIADAVLQIYIPLYKGVGDVTTTPSIFTRYYWTSNWTDWREYAGAYTPTAENFEGVLPVAKGGTGTTDVRTSQSMDPNAFRSQVGINYNDGHFLNIAYNNGLTNEYSRRYDAVLRVCAADVGGYITFNPFSKIMNVGGSGGNVINWHEQLAFKSDIPTLATSTTAGLVKPGTGLSITGDGTLNVTASGSGSKLYMVEFFGLQDLAHNVIIHIPYSPTSDSTTPDIEFLKDFVSNMAKHGYPALGAYGSGKEVYEVAASLNGRDNIVINTASSSNDTFYDMFEWTITSYPLFG